MMASASTFVGCLAELLAQLAVTLAMREGVSEAGRRDQSSWSREAQSGGVQGVPGLGTAGHVPIQLLGFQ